jgi:hypothetical protein
MASLPKKKKTMGAPQYRRFYFEVVPPLWPTYIGERRITFVKENGIKVRCYWELFALNTPPPKILFLKLATTIFGLD